MTETGKTRQGDRKETGSNSNVLFNLDYHYRKLKMDKNRWLHGNAFVSSRLDKFKLSLENGDLQLLEMTERSLASVITKTPKIIVV